MSGHDDRGSIAPVVPVLALVLLLLGGLVVDAARLLNARGRAVAYAEEAARAGAGAVDLGEPVLALDEGQARFRVERFCASLLADPAQNGGVRVCRFVRVEAAGEDDPRRIAVVVRVELDLVATLLGIVGVQRLPASAEARARPFEGVDRFDVDTDAPPVLVPSPPTPLDPVEPPGPIEIPAPVPVPSLSPSPSPSPSPSASPSAVPSAVPSASAAPSPSAAPTP